MELDGTVGLWYTIIEKSGRRDSTIKAVRNREKRCKASPNRLAQFFLYRTLGTSLWEVVVLLISYFKKSGKFFQTFFLCLFFLQKKLRREDCYFF